LFKQRGRVRGYVLVYQAFGETEPWCLITNNRALSVHYALRNWQEQSFRDLKSGGWNWQQSQVWQPDHAQVLLLVLALAYSWVLSLGTLVAHAEPAIQARIVRGTRRLYSIFREGLCYWLDLLGSRKPHYLGLFLPQINFSLRNCRVPKTDSGAAYRACPEGSRAMIELNKDERATVEHFIRRSKANARNITRAHILLKSAEGWSIERVAATYGVSEATVSNVRARYRAGGVERMLKDKVQQKRRRALAGSK
jgi:hypothetical protein